MLAPVLLLLAFQAAPVQWTLTAAKPPAAVKAGGRIQVVLKASIQEGWHLYSLKKLEGGPIATTITLPEGQPFRLAGDIDASAPLSNYDETFQMDVESYAYSATFQLPVDAAQDARPGAVTLTVNARFQACDDKQCLPPRTMKVELPVTIGQ
ncbi:MAG: protein-disulfide reductase DsbD N-terminal domain-containing protein [Acidobacteria bacterium]|nr:protein-disulfide reductase DsbD N-terminal domain-containing protein [Acidobacteriota bacterium]